MKDSALVAPKENDDALIELIALELAQVGGGIGDVILG